MQVEPRKFLFFFTFSRVICRHQSFLVYCPPDQLRGDFKVVPNMRYKRGEVIARGAVDTGDQVFVDKFSYNFIKPHRGRRLRVSEPTIFRASPAIPIWDSRFTLSGWPACLATRCASIRLNFLLTDIWRKSTDSNE